ncbi:MAG: glycosyltransferase family 2 protein [Thermodesulfovibrionia bacterium]
MLSVAIITHNEEKNIRDALESVEWANEIVVVDSFSNDRTVEICREYTDRVFSIEWSGFANQKNMAISLTTMPWVLVLDADERVTEGLRDEIVSILKDKPEKDGYYIARKNFFSGRWIRHGGWWPDYTLRLFRRDKGRFEDREVHEAVKVDGEVGYLKNPLEHHTYKDINDFLKRMELYSSLSAKELYKNKRMANILDIIFRPPATFLRMLILQLGFLDGLYGIILAYLYSLYTYKKYSKLRKLWKG